MLQTRDGQRNAGVALKPAGDFRREGLCGKQTADTRDVILVRTETSPEDIHGMHAAKGILTARGGMTSHAAVVARGMGRPCVAGAGDAVIDYKAKTMTV